MSITNAGIFVPDLKTNPHLNFARFQGEVFQEAMNTENAILGQYGLLYIFLSNAEWEALPGNLLEAAVPAVPAVLGGAAAIAAIPAVYRDRYDYTTPVPRPANNASNAVLKETEFKRTIRRQYIKHTCSCVQSSSTLSLRKI